MFERRDSALRCHAGKTEALIGEASVMTGSYKWMRGDLLVILPHNPEGWGAWAPTGNSVLISMVRMKDSYW